MSKIVDIVLSKYQYALKDFEIEEKETEIYIRMITIKRGMKRKGIGSAIVREVQEYAKSKKKLLRLIVVGTWRERMLLNKFYTRLGFEYRMNEAKSREYFIKY